MSDSEHFDYAQGRRKRLVPEKLHKLTNIFHANSAFFTHVCWDFSSSYSSSLKCFVGKDLKCWLLSYHLSILLCWWGWGGGTK